MTAHTRTPAPAAPFDGTQLCAQTDPDLFFPMPGGSPERAKAVCRRCPLQDRCLQWALRHRQEWGVWGGLSAEQRRRMLTKRGETP